MDKSQVVDEEEDYIDKQFEKKDDQQVSSLLKQLRLQASSLTDGGMADDLNKTITQISDGQQIDQATLFKQFMLKHADKRKKKMLISKID